MSKILDKYIRHFTNNGPEYVLETAARDTELSDSDYVRLWKKVTPVGGRANSHAMKLGDRDYARKVS